MTKEPYFIIERDHVCDLCDEVNKYLLKNEGWALYGAPVVVPGYECRDTSFCQALINPLKMPQKKDVIPFPETIFDNRNKIKAR